MVGRTLEPTPLVGRRRELESIRRLLESGRLVTLTGVGGTGKTRLARRVAGDLTRAFKDGVWFVELADVEDPSLLGLTVARRLGLQVGTGEWHVSVLTDFLGERRALLVLDNCEHLADTCADLVDEVLLACPGVRVLTTSQRALGLVSENIFQVPPLSLPGEQLVGTDPEGLRHYEAVTLFVDRASALHPEFELTGENADSVIALCRALEGIPLALELAAARIRVLSPEAMLERLHDRYRLLSHGYSGRVPDRQRSLEASVQWTFELCTQVEQRLWAVLSVFRGGMSLDSIEDVAAGAGVAEVLDVLTALVEKSVLLRDGQNGSVRFRMLETIRLYGERCLAEQDEEARVRRLHLEHFLAVAERCGHEWIGPDQVTWLDRLRDDHSNIRAALQFAVDQCEAESALRIVTSLEGYWIAAGLVSEARRWFDKGFSVPAESDAAASPGRVTALRVATWFALIQTDMIAAARLADEADWLARDLDDPAARADVLMGRGLLVAWEGDAPRGAELLEQCAEQFRQLGNVRDQVYGLLVCGELRGFIGDIEGARRAEEKVVALTEARGELYYRSFALALLAVVGIDAGELDRARELLHESLRMKRQLDDRLGVALSLEVLAWAAVAEERAERAAMLLGAATSTWRSIGMSIDVLPFFSVRRAEGQAAVQRMLPGRRFHDAVARGQEMDLETATSFGLEEEKVDQKRPSKTDGSPLTPRETEVAGLVADGLTNQEIADRLVISTRTAEAHVENILRKLGFSSRHAVTAWVAEQRSA